MNFPLLPAIDFSSWHRTWKSALASLLSTLFLALVCVMLMGTPPAWAGLNDDRFDGNIFPLYAGNGSLFPGRVTLPEAMRGDRPVLLVFFVNDSSDCKLYAQVVSELDAYYGRAANIIPIDADSIPPQAEYAPTEPGYYYKGLVPQTVVLDQSHKVVYDKVGNVPFEQTDDVLRQVFDLLPRSESQELKRRQINEFNAELTTQ